MNQADYMKEDGVGLGRLVSTGQVSRDEVIKTAIDVIERLNPQLNAVVLRNFEAAMVTGTGAGPLAGAPFLLKDVNLYSADMPTTFGSAYFRNAPPRQDSTMVARWRSAGLAILGKTNTPEFAAEFVTEPRAYGKTLNPRAPGLTVGGSSGGAAAAVAAGMVPLAHATDLGGSIRIPAACCGVFGFKPTAGLNPVGPYFDQIAGGLNSDHVITRSVRDSAASLDITAERSPIGSSYLESLNRTILSTRIGYCDTDSSGRRCDTEQQRALKQAASLLGEHGHIVTEYRYPDGLSAGEWFDYLWIYDILKLVAEREALTGYPPLKDELEPLSWHLMAKAKAAPLDARQRAQDARKSYIARYLGSMKDVDILLTPSLATLPPPDETLSFNAFKDVDAWNEAGYRFAPHSIPANIAGQPSASCPYFSTTEGIPVGIQITGKPGADLLVLQLCAQLERWAQP